MKAISKTKQNTRSETPLTLLRTRLRRIVYKRREVAEEEEGIESVRDNVGIDHEVVVEFSQQLRDHHIPLLVVVVGKLAC